MMQRMSKLYFKMNEGFLALPLNFPGTTLWYAARARKELISIMTPMAEAARKHIASGGDVRCLMDVWLHSVKVADAADEGEEAATITALHNTDEEIAYHMLDFLFASQVISVLLETLWFCLHKGRFVPHFGSAVMLYMYRSVL